MNRKAYIMLLMFLSWPVNILHRWMNNRPISYFYPFPFELQEISHQYYVHDLLGLVSWLMIFWGIWLYVTGNYKQDKDFKTILGAHFINLCIDLPHYLLAYQRSEIVMFVQGMVILSAAFLYFRRKIKTKELCRRN